MSERQLRLIIRTPQEVVFDARVTSLRLPTDTGQVGLRPRSEACVLPVEPGLVILRQNEQVRYAGTAGGLLHCDGMQASLMTPVAVVGDSLQDVQAELDQTLAAPSAEREIRTMLTRLEKTLLHELQSGSERRISPGGQSP